MGGLIFYFNLHPDAVLIQPETKPPCGLRFLSVSRPEHGCLFQDIALSGFKNPAGRFFLCSVFHSMGHLAGTQAPGIQDAAVFLHEGKPRLLKPPVRQPVSACGAVGPEGFASYGRSAPVRIDSPLL